MRIIASVKDPGRLGDIGDVIHDCWFELQDLTFEPTTSTLSIKFARLSVESSRMLNRRWLLKRWEIPIIDCYLHVHNVENYEIKDTERVGTYNFNDLEYDPNRRRITITTGIPIGIQITVREVEVVVEETDNVVGVKRIRTIFDLA